MNTLLDEFYKRHNIRVIDINKRVANIHQIDINFFKNSNDFNEVYTNSYMQTEPLYTIEIPLSKLENLAQFEKQVFNNMSDRGHYNLFEILMEQKEKENQLKNQYPAVKLAYENYSLMLKLAEGGEL